MILDNTLVIGCELCVWQHTAKVPGTLFPGDDVQFSVAIEIRKAKIFASHRVIIDECLPPLPARLVQWRKKFNPNFDARFVYRPPAGDDLIAAQAKQVATGQRMAIHKRCVDDTATPQRFRVGVRWLEVGDEVRAVHRLDGRDEPATTGEPAQSNFARAAAFIAGKLNGFRLRAAAMNGKDAFFARNQNCRALS